MPQKFGHIVLIGHDLGTHIPLYHHKTDIPDYTKPGQNWTFSAILDFGGQNRTN